MSKKRTLFSKFGFAVVDVASKDTTDVALNRVHLAERSQALDNPKLVGLQHHVQVEEVPASAPVQDGVQLGG